MVEADQTAEPSVPDAGSLRRRRNFAARVLLVIFLLLVAILLYLWSNRTDLAANFIDERLAQYDVPVTYTVDTISSDRQVLTNLVVGSPARPDLTIERLEIDLTYGLSGLQVGQTRLVKPRLWGEIGPDRISFGTLDEILFPSGGQDEGLPALDVAIIDGRARIDTPYGPIGVKADGEGILSERFSGMLAANAPRLAIGDCVTDEATLFGKFVLTGGSPRISGPMRVGQAQCGGGELRIAGMNLPVVITANDDFSDIAATFEGQVDEIAASTVTAGLTDLSGRVEFAGTRLVGSYEVQSRLLSAGNLGARRLIAGGGFRSGENLSGWDITADGTAEDIRVAGGLGPSLDSIEDDVAGTLLAPLLAKASRALERQLDGSQLRGSARYRDDGRVARITIPRAVLTGNSGVMLGSVTRGSAMLTGRVPRLAGNFATGGADLPRIEGRMEQDARGRLALNLGMAEYAVGRDRLSIPRMMIRQVQSGNVIFDGEVHASGRLPGGAVDALRLPVAGHWTGAGLALWDRCIEARFDRLVYANLEVGRQGLVLCPVPGKPILQAGKGAGPKGLRIAAGTGALDVSGALGGTALRIKSGPVGFAWPGTLTAKSLNVQLGVDDSAVNFAVTDLTGRLGEELTGRFENADILLAAVPLDIREASGSWSYRDSTLAIADGAFVLQDREETDRFEPLIATGADLVLAENRIAANALLRSPVTGAEVTRVAIEHDLASGTGSADLFVAGITFSPSLQPTDLTGLALGVVANVKGTVSGNGRIDWGEQGVTSRGAFSSDGLDLAAIFGPVEGARGTIVFDDLLGLTTAPDQRLSVRSINPGIEVFDGTVQFSLTDGELLAVQGGSWPFLGGTLEMRPVSINIGASEVREYRFLVTGLEASQLLERLELANFSANGTFDGDMRLVFDEAGNGRIENGQLAARPPGGTLSYVGELTYEDLSPIANFAFDALRSLQYEQMVVVIDGPLTGDILTKVRFDGVSQGEGAKRNFITRRLASLPIRFNVNIRAPFYQILTSLRSIYDPAYVRDPREVGLIGQDGERLGPQTFEGQLPGLPSEGPPVSMDATRMDDGVQTSESENMQ